MTRRFFFAAMSSVTLGLGGGCPLTAYPDRQIPCEPDGEPCPERQRCVDPDGDKNHHCYVVGCGDGIVDVDTEQCDDANDNELDLCVKCRAVSWATDVDAILGFGPGGSVAKGTPLGRPTTIAIDLDGNILLGSAGTNVVTRLVPGASGFNVAQFGGNGTMLGNAVIAEDDRPNEMSTAFVTSIAIDTFGSVFLGDFQDSVVRRVDAVTGLVDTIAGTGIRSSAILVEEAPPTRGTETDLDLPTSLVVDADGSLLFTENAPGGGLSERMRRFDPSTGLISVEELASLASGTIDDLVLDDAGRLHAFHREAQFVIETTDNEQVVDFFITVTTYERAGDRFVFQAPLRGIRTRREFRSLTPPEVRTDVFLPGIGPGQAHVATSDGDRFYVLMGKQVAELDLLTPEVPALRVLATVPNPVDDTGGGDILGISDAGGAANLFAFDPTDLALHDGGIFVTDPGNGVVWRFETTRDEDVDGVPGNDEVIAGILPAPASVPVSNVINDVAIGFARESDGRVGVGASDDCGAANLLDAESIEFYLAFPDLHRVLFSNCNGAPGILAGTGEPGFSGDNGLAENARLDTPTAFLRIDRPRPDGTLDDAFYIADRNNDRIRRLFLENVDLVPAQTCTVDGQCDAGVVCRKADGAAPDDEGVCAKPSLLIATFPVGVDLLRPSGLAMDDTRALLIADSGNHRVLRHDLETGETTTIFGTGVAGFNGDDGTPTTTQLHEPTSVVYLPLALISTLAELNGDPLPVQLSGGLVVVTERAGHRVRGAFIPPVPGFPEVLTLAGDGTPGDDDAPDDGTAGRLNLPRSVMFSIPDVEQQQLSFFVVDGIDRIRELTLRVDLDLATLGLSTGLSTREGRAGLSRNDGGRETAAFRTPSALAFLDERRQLVVDRATGRLRLAVEVADAAGGEVVTTVAGLPEGAVPPVNGSGRPSTPAVSAITSSPLRDPTDIAVQLDVEPPVAWITEASTDLRTPRGLRRVQLHDVQDPATWTTDILEVPDLVRPAALAIQAGDLFVADEGAHAVFRVDAATGGAEVVAGRPGVRGDAGDGRAAIEALLNGPAGVAIQDDALLIADTGNNRVRRVHLAPSGDGLIGPFLGDGDPASGGEGQPASAFPVLAPRGIAIDEAGNVVVAASNVVRFVQAGRRGVAEATDDVRTIYGKAPRVAFPDSATRCLDDVVFAPAIPGRARRIVTVDACLGLVIPLIATSGP